MSFKSETPFIKDPNIKGIAMSLRAFINIVPKGLIQSEIKLDPKDKRFTALENCPLDNAKKIILFTVRTRKRLQILTQISLHIC